VIVYLKEELDLKMKIEYRIVEFFKKNMYKLISSIIVTIISWLTIRYEYSNCTELVGSVVFIGCEGILGGIISLLSIIPIISEYLSLVILLHPPNWLDWILSFILYYLFILFLIFAINKIKTKRLKGGDERWKKIKRIN